MKPKNETRTLHTIAETARRLGRARGTLYNWIRAGCPHHHGRFDLAEVEAWAVHRKRGPVLRHLAKQERDTRNSKPATLDPETPLRAELDTITAALGHPEGVDGAIARLRALERAAFKLYADVHGDTEAGLTRAKLHSEITGHLLKAEGLREQTVELDAKLWAECQSSLIAWAEPIKCHLTAMPRTLAPRCNPLDAATAETVLREWVNTIFYPLLNQQPTKTNPKE